MKKICVIVTAVVIAALVFMAILIPETGAQTDNSQSFTPSRYVVMAADIDVDSLQVGAAPASRRFVVKMDTVTGRTWLLQVGMTGGNDPRIRSTSWHEVGGRREKRD